MIFCARCNTSREPEDFHRNASKPSGFEATCKLCALDRKLIRRYGIDRFEYQVMLASQDGMCAICLKPAGKRTLHVDHCHTQGHVRGLLCSNCNRAIGLLGDNPDVMVRAASYVEANRSN